MSNTPGNIERHPVPGITLACMDPHARDMMDLALEQWEEHHARVLENIKGTSIEATHDPVYSFAYWLFRYSGLVDTHAQDLAEAAIAVGRLNFDQPDSIRPRTNGAVDAYHKLEDAVNAYLLARGETGIDWWTERERG